MRIVDILIAITLGGILLALPATWEFWYQILWWALMRLMEVALWV